MPKVAFMCNLEYSGFDPGSLEVKAAVLTPPLHLLPSLKIQVLKRSCYLYDLHAWNSFSSKMFFPLYQLFIEESLCICRVLKGSYYFTILIFPAVQIIVLTSQCLEMLFTSWLLCIVFLQFHVLNYQQIFFAIPDGYSVTFFSIALRLHWSEQRSGNEELVNFHFVVLGSHTLGFWVVCCSPSPPTPPKRSSVLADPIKTSISCDYSERSCHWPLWSYISLHIQKELWQRQRNQHRIRCPRTVLQVLKSKH